MFLSYPRAIRLFPFSLYGGYFSTNITGLHDKPENFLFTIQPHNFHSGLLWCKEVSKNHIQFFHKKMILLNKATSFVVVASTPSISSRLSANRYNNS